MCEISLRLDEAIRPNTYHEPTTKLSSARNSSDEAAEEEEINYIYLLSILKNYEKHELHGGS